VILTPHGFAYSVLFSTFQASPSGTSTSFKWNTAEELPFSSYSITPNLYVSPLRKDLSAYDTFVLVYDDFSLSSHSTPRATYLFEGVTLPCILGICIYVRLLFSILFFTLQSSIAIFAYTSSMFTSGFQFFTESKAYIGLSVFMFAANKYPSLDSIVLGIICIPVIELYSSSESMDKDCVPVSSK